MDKEYSASAWLEAEFFCCKKAAESRCFPKEVHVTKLHLVGTVNRIGILENKEKQKFYMLFSDIDTILQPRVRFISSFDGNRTVQSRAVNTGSI